MTTADREAGAPRVVAWAELPEQDRFAAAAELARRYPVVLLIPPDDPASLLALLEAGVRGLVGAGAGAPAVELAVAAVAAGGQHVSADLAARFAERLDADPRLAEAALTAREVEVLQGIVAGLTHRQVARRIGVTEATVHTYAKKLRRKLGAANKADLTRRAVELGYAERHL